LNEGDKEIYDWQKQTLDQLEIPYLLIPGNHDDVEVMAESFNMSSLLSNSEMYYEVYFDDYQFLMLDTSQGFLSKAQKNWLLEKVLDESSQPLVIVMHHPPDLMEVPHMDERHYLRDKDEVMQIFYQSKRQMEIFCGHYHVEKTVCFENFRVHITPSCYFQIDSFSKLFKVGSTQIAFRIIDLFERRMDISLHYLPGSKVMD
jgi:Icc protein